MTVQKEAKSSAGTTGQSAPTSQAGGGNAVRDSLRGATFEQGQAALRPEAQASSALQLKPIVQLHGHGHGQETGAPDVQEVPETSDTPETSDSPETQGGNAQPPQVQQRPMTNQAAQGILQGAFGNVKNIVAGNIQVLGQAQFQAAYDRIYGNGQYSWARYVAPRFGNLNGFAHNGTNYINRSTAGLHTVVHEMLHNNAAGDWTNVVGSEFNEGTTEWLTQYACARLNPPEPAPTCYPGQTPCVQQALNSGLPQADLISAYFNGGARQKIAEWAGNNCVENWGTIRGHMQAQNWAAARAGLQRKPGGSGGGSWV